MEALRARPDDVQAVFLAAGRKRDRDLDERLERHGLKAVSRTSTELDALTGGANHQGLALVLGEFTYVHLDDLLATPPEAGPLLVLDQVQDPHNLGAVLRSAYVLGAVGAVIPERRACAVTAAVVRTSAGATEHLPVARVVNLSRALGAMKDAGYWIYGAAGEQGQAPEELDLTGRVALVLGSEGHGLRPSVQQACDLVVTIPMAGPLSLNVSVAAGVLLAEAARQRRR